MCCCVTLKWPPDKALEKVKRGIIAQVFANLAVLALQEKLISLCQGSRVITFHFAGKPQRQSLLLYSFHVSTTWKDTNMVSQYKAL